MNEQQIVEQCAIIKQKGLKNVSYLRCLSCMRGVPGPRKRLFRVLTRDYPLELLRTALAILGVRAGL